MAVRRYLNAPAAVGGGIEGVTAARSDSSTEEHEWNVQDGGAFRYWPSSHATVGSGGTASDGDAHQVCDTEPLKAATAGDKSSAATLHGVHTEDNVQDSVDVLPGGGTVVMFDSRRLRHAVCPSQRRRIALSAWFVSPAAAVDSCKL